MEDFSSYDLIIDARSEREYEEDHIPGAINLPVVKNDEYAEVGATHKDDKHQAYLDSALETYIGDSLKKGWINIYEPYREVHKENLKAVHEYYKDKPLLKLD